VTPLRKGKNKFLPLKGSSLAFLKVSCTRTEDQYLRNMDVTGLLQYNSAICLIVMENAVRLTLI